MENIDTILRESALKHLKKNLGPYFEDFASVLNEKPKRAIRINALKAKTADIASALSLKTPTAYCADAYLIDNDLSGDHPYHHAGLYYMQEPSAMLPVEAARPYLTDLFDSIDYPLVLDMCAAPGGKTGHIAALMNGRGALLSNEIVFKRALILASNVERLGIRNTLVTSDSPAKIADLLEESFDAVIVDAPCSGEGMLRKETAAWNNMNEKTMLSCAERQSEIMSSATKCVKKGGLLIYSTCTLNRTENEQILLPFIESGEFEALPCPYLKSVHESDSSHAYRALPQDGGGEGHFTCVMRKLGGSAKSPKFVSPFDGIFKNTSELKRALSPLSEDPIFDTAYLFRDSVILSPQLPFVKGLSIVKAGIKAATVTKKTLIPDHAYALALNSEQAKPALDLYCELGEEKERAVQRGLLEKYLHGEEIEYNANYKGFGIIAADSYPFGLVKISGSAVKNHYPKGLRIN